MSNPVLKIKIAGWVERARPDTATYQQRQPIEIILNSIAMTLSLDVKMFLKGGNLKVLHITAENEHSFRRKIHPYYGGNGRTARLLATLVLHIDSYDLKGNYLT